MCSVIWDCIKCPAKVLCCCCQSAVNMICGMLCSVIVLAVVIAVIVYFTMYFHKGRTSEHQMVRQLVTTVPLTFKDYFQHKN
ncbi:protein midgut expression 1-like [Bactrocera tryoni]|uniref:protein midgut expression 1-like n=1 Tax=Bactrocera tryoni TaxID=59916 RepID=UPI001A97CC5F|nr:protein midgut expression 1-like [Bactrocera tryoni]